MRPADLRGFHQRDRNPTCALEPGKKYGWLTAHHQSAGDKRYMVFSCRCGQRVIRKHTDVRESIEGGRIPACMACRTDAIREANRQLRLAVERERQTG